MQKGRKYRAGQPRGNLPENGYNQRWPMRMDFLGEFDYLGVRRNIPASQTRGLCTFDALAIAWSCINTYAIGAFGFTHSGLLRKLPLPWIWEVVLEITDGIGQARNTWTFDNRGFPSIGIGPNWIFPTPTSIVTTAPFGPVSYQQFSPVPYAME